MNSLDAFREAAKRLGFLEMVVEEFVADTKRAGVDLTVMSKEIKPEDFERNVQQCITLLKNNMPQNWPR